MDHEGILDRLPVVVYVVDSASGDVLYLSEGVKRYLGHVPDDLGTSTAEWRGHVHPDDAKDVPILGEPTRAAGRPFEAEYRMLTADGETVWVREEAVLIPADGGLAPFWQGTVTDITARREVEEASWRSAFRFRAILDELPAIVYMNSLDIPLKTTYISSRLEAILGVKPEEWIENRRLWMDLAHPDDLERMMVEDVADYPDGRYLSEFRMLARDGRVVWFRDEAVLVRDEEGNPTHWEGVLVDISEQKVAEESLREAEERFRILVEKGSAVVYIDEAAPPWNTVYISPQVFDVFGWTQEDYLREQDLWEKALHPDDRERVLAEDAVKDDTGETTSIEYRLIDVRGETLWIQERSNRVIDADGSPLYEMGVMVDITERKLAEEMSAELAAQTYELGHLREMDDMKSAFMSAVSHELRTPLTSVLGGALTLQNSGKSMSEEDYDRILRMIVEGGHKMGKLLTDLLDVERLSRGATILQPWWGDVGEIVGGVVADCGALEGHPVETEIATVRMRFDSVKVERIVDNLLTNADRHTPAGTPIRISVASRRGGAWIVVEDEGPGVPDELKTVIFDSFRQGDTPEHSPGVGVGLALVAKLAELHGGRAWVEDREGGGASFNVVLASLSGQA